MAKTKTGIPEHDFVLRFWWLLLPFVFIGVLVYVYILRDLPSPRLLSSAHIPQATQIYDRHGILLYSIYGNKNQVVVPLSDIPKSVQQATIAIEDKNFYYHGAIDLRGIMRSLVFIFFHKQLQGGSTLTQQLVKNSLLSPERTVMRKVKEVVLAFATEILYSKQQILEMYLNQTPYGGTAWGIEAASQMYFGKPAKKLTLAESAMLAGLPEAPTTFSPFGAHPELGKRRQKDVLEKMQEQGYITSSQEKKALATPLIYQTIAHGIKAPHFVFYVKDVLIAKYGIKMVEEGGLKVTTSLDYALQETAQASLAAQVNALATSHVTNGAAIITTPGTGEILAMIGSKDYFDTAIDGNVNLTIANRQPGSSIKPLNYAAGLGNGYTAATPFVDTPKCFPNPGGQQYCPGNYDGAWHGVVQMRYALANSFNMPAVKMLQFNGLETMIATASAMGITTLTQPQRYGLALTLGGGEVTMVDMATAYGVFANGGYRVDLHPILTIKKNTGEVLESYIPPLSPFFGKRVLPSGVAFIISDILADNGARAQEFGLNSSLFIKNHSVSAKTGTTNDFRDNWTFGYTPSYVVGTWVGNNDNSKMTGISSGITGAAPIWHDLMAYLLADSPSQPPQKPDTVIQKFVCTTSGLLPPAEGSPNRCQTRLEYFIKGTEPTKTDPGMQKVFVDKSTQDLPRPEQTDNLEEKEHVVVTDAGGDKYCVDCAHPTPSPHP